jgi:hypothetical protein
MAQALGYSYGVAVPESKATALKPMRVDARTRTAYHEAGHAVLSAAIADTPERVSILPDAHTLGRSSARMSVHPVSRVQVHLAGFAAEHIVTGRRPRQLDQEVGFAIISRLDPALRAAFVGSKDRDGQRAVQEVLGMCLVDTDDDIKREVDRYYQVARESLAAVWRVVDRVTLALLEHDELDRRGLDDAIGDTDIYQPVFAVQQAHGLGEGAGGVALDGLVPSSGTKPCSHRRRRSG